mgnify:CR=1 FL=1
MEERNCPMCSQRKKERSPEEYKKLINRLSRIEGQIRGIRSMVENGAYCPDILVQSAAANAALNAFNKELLASHLRSCVANDIREGHDEVIDDTAPYEIFDPEHIWKRKIVTNFRAVPLQVQLFKGGECVYTSPTVEQIRNYCKAQLETMWDEVLRFENPHTYYVDLSKKLWDVKYGLLEKYDGNKNL